MSSVDIGGKWKGRSVQKVGVLLGYDWGVGIEPQSPHSGLLTFKHQGCKFFEPEEEESEPTSE